MIISRINYTRLSKDFLSEKNILKAKEILLATNEKLKMYERVRTDFFANISHELRTPLNVIYSAEQMAERMVNSGNINSKKLDKYLKMMKQNCYRLIKLINNLIDITKIEAANFEIRLRNMDIVKVVEDITLSVADYIENKGIILIFDTEIEEKVIACDPDVVERVMLNLLSNAVKFTEEGGNIFVNIYESEGQVYLSVKDTGVGMSEKAKEQIFSRFVQVDKSARRCREGSGIGLSLVKSLLEVHGGSISVESRLGEGSEFTVVLWDRILEDEGVTRQVSKGLDERIQMVNIEFSDIYK
ncbi:MAG TPA: sensor histidine kinase [Erysipelotrichaceae bacterium]|jgi:signal transduction histidine kinase|nr:HAMP domain-containing histidine kinase [Clostridia bacterium]HCY07194.1 sensor histidine kinase [Erysipelotrichaceae bacterium]